MPSVSRRWPSASKIAIRPRLALAEDVQRYVAGEPVSAYRKVSQRSLALGQAVPQGLGALGGAVLLLGLLAFAAVTIREAERRRIAASEDAERLKKLDQARQDVKEFRRLADQGRFYAAMTDQVSEQAAYFDPKLGENKMREALAVSEKWGSDLEKLPLQDEVVALKDELYDLNLLLAQSENREGMEAEAARETLQLLEAAGRFGDPSRGYYRLRARAEQRLGDEEKAALDQQQAADPQVRTIALDLFLDAEQLRTDAVGRVKGEKKEQAWQSDPKKIEKAIDLYRQALAKDPNHYWSHFQLGRCYLRQQRFAEAVETLGACVALQPKVPWGYSVRGLALAMQKRYPEAERDLNQAVEMAHRVPAVSAQSRWRVLDAGKTGGSTR